MVWIALLRGINVGGHMVKMEHLRRSFTELGLTNVRTYIQTGNVFFEAPEDDRAALAQRIEQHLREALGYDINGRPPSSLTPLEKTLGGKTTTRFFHTTAQILAAAKQGQEGTAEAQGGMSDAVGGHPRAIPRAKSRR